MSKEYNKSSALKNLKNAIEILESGGDHIEVGSILVDTLGEGVCDLHCITTNSSFLQTVFDLLPIPIYYKDIYGVYIGCNNALAELYGRRKEDILGKTVFDIFTKEEAQIFSYSDMVLLKENSHEMVEHRGRFSAMGGSYHILHKKVILNYEGSIAGVLGIITDISDHKLSEERAWQNEAFYKSLFEQSPIPRVIFDSFNMVEDMNLSAAALFGRDSDLLGSDVAHIFANYEDFEVLIKSGGKPVKVKLICSKSKEPVDAIASLTVSGVSDIEKFAVSFIVQGELL